VVRIEGVVWDDEDALLGGPLVLRGRDGSRTKTPPQEAGEPMKRKKEIPRLRSDRAAADFWTTHDSAPYASTLKEERIAVNPRLRRRVAARAAAKKAVTLRLENQQIALVKEVARRKSVPYQTLMRMWIAEGLAKDSSRSA